MAGFLEHLTKSGERWDTIAFDYYGNPALMTHIIAANIERLGAPLPLVFEAATMIKVPVLEIATISDDQLPPWKRK